MTIDCGSQFFLCDLPIRLDTYSWCSHWCKYCFTQRKINIWKIKKIWTLKSVKNFVEWKRNLFTTRADWNIPLHWWWMSDPFQPTEKKEWISLEILKYLVQKQYPFVVSTKWKLIKEEPYKTLLKKANCVLQISLVDKEYDKIELWAPTRQERVDIIKEMKWTKRIIVRCQPYHPWLLNNILKNIEVYSEIWVYWVIFEWIKLQKKTKWYVKVWWDKCIDEKMLKTHFELLKQKCHKYNLKFYSWENRLRNMWDDLCCCWIDWLWWKANNYNLNHYLYDKENFKPTEAMKQEKSWACALKINQSKRWWKVIKNMSFQDVVDICTKDKEKLKIMWKKI